MKNKWFYIIGGPMAIGLAYRVLLAYHPPLDAVLVLLKGLLIVLSIILIVLVYYITNLTNKGGNNDEADIW